ncbi:hypothetical protein C8T65DRAFT_700590 [Cerioporus squamosus]|nr:hypothetical protein C8T65DRAFT_700590 [Cerioporus squamosus]
MSIEDSWTGVTEASSSPSLRRCRDKECQKKGWKTHKLSCRGNTTVIAQLEDSDWSVEMQDLGFTSFSHFGEDLHQWKDAQGWALHMCAVVAVIRGGGIHASQNPQKMLSFILTPRRSVTTDLPSNRNPSLIFQFKGQHLFDLEERLAGAPAFREQWEDGAPARAAKNAKYSSHPLFAGILPILLMCDKLAAPSGLEYIPQWHSNPAMLPYAETLAPMREAVLEDILHLAVGSINAGFPLRSVIGPPTRVLPGRFVRKHGAWTWQQLFSDWTQYRRGQHAGLDETLAGLRSGLPPSDLIELIHSLVLS